MATKITHTLKCQFAGDNETEFYVNVPDYDTEKTDSEIQNGVEAMLASGALGIGSHAATAAIGATKVDTTTTDVLFI